jgi:hypothetical protein
MITTPLGAQYLQTALAKWRQAHPWANHLAWEQMPQRYKDEIELAARLMMTVGRNTVEQVVDFVPDGEADDLAA